MVEGAKVATEIIRPWHSYSFQSAEMDVDQSNWEERIEVRVPGAAGAESIEGKEEKTEVVQEDRLWVLKELVVYMFGIGMLFCC